MKPKPVATVTFEPAAAGDSRAPRPEDAALFHAVTAAGKKLAELHLGYEQQPEFPLRRRENPQSPLNWRVEKMRLSKDKSSLVAGIGEVRPKVSTRWQKGCFSKSADESRTPGRMPRRG